METPVAAFGFKKENQWETTEITTTHARAEGLCGFL
jgi:hypothetical protein